ncbi:hypothetical protein [Nonlabens ponticola]|uniref:Uncharacterized protein n=1 Tax=Nonlabens ponticola TaxID=2496866 RepID=A0A3S9MUA8_9FLAO|nr:hypothetical protein [Nonlabens ponticola]AZQ42762.1 hypothetical protein EJ995_00375 [Nonlabens ponticola]
MSDKENQKGNSKRPNASIPKKVDTTIVKGGNSIPPSRKSHVGLGSEINKVPAKDIGAERQKGFNTNGRPKK